jgi:pimeloyl-ACP methyl ester carboxylesterase
MAEGMLPDHYQVISYHRVGYACSSRVSGSVSIAQQAQHAIALLKYLEIKRTHIVGHSSGGNIALQVALDAPDLIQTIVLLEPALKVEKDAAERASAVAKAYNFYGQGNKAAAVDAFMVIVAGPDYRTDLDQFLPGAFDQAIADADTFFGQELPALREWSFTAEDAHRIKQPALAVIGEKNAEVPVWKARQQMLLTWLPNAQPFVLPGATHLLHLQNPQGMVDGLNSFFEAHSLSSIK